MTLLAIDTATRILSLALHDGRNLIAEQTVRAGRQHNRLLAPAIQQLLTMSDVDMPSLTAVAVAIGPGSYTGLRIGVAMAKGIAEVSNLPLIGVTTLDILAVANPFQNTRYRLLAVVQAGRGRIIGGEYRVKKGRWVLDSDPEITTWQDWLQDREGSFYVTGEIDEDGFEQLQQAKEREGLSLTIMKGALRSRRAGFLAEEALRRLKYGKEDDYHPSKLLPIYMKTPDGA
jgi:tRNA threonylcarbamoyladenosine biosynthesis protein TsaB